MEISCPSGYKTPENKHPRYVDINGRSLLWAPVVPKSQLRRRPMRAHFEAHELWVLLQDYKKSQESTTTSNMAK